MTSKNLTAWRALSDAQRERRIALALGRLARERCARCGARLLTPARYCGLCSGYERRRP